MVYFSVAVLLFSILLLYKSSEWVIRYSISLARLLGISTFVIGFILVAISTSLPEIFVTIFATFEGDANLAVGNILGSNLFDLNVISGLTTLLVGTIYMKRQETIHLIELLFITSAITLVILSLPRLSLIHGIILLVLFGYMLVKLYKGGKVPEIHEEGPPILPKRKKGILAYLRSETIPLAALKFGISIAILLGGTKLLVDSSVEIAGFFGLTTAFIGATIVATGTSLPELSVTFAAVKKKQYALAMGDLIGSAVTNITLVLGILSIINPGPLNVVVIGGMLPFLIISSLVVWFTLNKKRKITSFEGVLLLLIYIGFILEQLGIIALFG